MAKTIDRHALIALVGISTGMLAGCGPSDGQWQVCTDQQGRRQPDGDCQGNRGGHGAWASGSSWRYIKRTSSAPAIGEVVSGGSTAPLNGTAYAAPREGIVRGGFGHFGEGFGGHGGGE